MKKINIFLTIMIIAVQFILNSCKKEEYIPKLESILVKELPSKIDYYNDELLNLNGLIITLVNENGEQKAIAFENFAENNLSCYPLNNSKLSGDNGEVTITENNTKINISFNINVKINQLVGDIKLININSKEIKDYNDIIIELLSNNLVLSTKTPDLNGEFKFENLEFKDYLMTIKKPNYRCFDTIKIAYNYNLDTLSEIILLEDPPVNIFIKSFYYDYLSGMNRWEGKMEYYGAGDCMIGTEFFFSKSANVSYQNYNLSDRYGSYTNLNFFNPYYFKEAYSCSLNNYLDNGLKKGDFVYLIAYPTNDEFYELLYNDEFRNFEIISHRRVNPSNIYSFRLDY